VSAPPKLLPVGGEWKVAVGDTLRLVETVRYNLPGISCGEDILRCGLCKQNSERMLRIIYNESGESDYLEMEQVFSFDGAF